MPTYVSQQLDARLDSTTIRNRLKTLRSFGVPIEDVDFERALGKAVMNACIKKLKGLKNKAGTEHKPLIPLVELRKVYESPMDDPKDVDYQLLWFLLVISGQRVGNLLGATFSLERDGIRIIFREGRKNDLQALRAGVLYLFAWTEEPPLFLQEKMHGTFRCPNLGTKTNIAGNLNSWLRRNGYEYTSGVPRVHLDNILRRLHDASLLSTESFCRLMDHNLSTSDKHYRAI